MFSDYALQSLLQIIGGGISYAPPADVYLALSQTAPTQAKGTSGAPWNFTEPAAQAQLTTALTSGTAYTSLAVSPLDQAVASGDSILLTSGANTQIYVASASAAVGATSISVTSQNANFSYPVGTLVQDTTTAGAYERVAVTNDTTNFALLGTQPAAGVAVDNATAISFPQSTGPWGTVAYVGAFDAKAGGDLLYYCENRATSGTLSTATGTGSVTSLAVTALTIAIASGATVRLISGGNTQEFTTSAAVAVGATSIPVVSQLPLYDFPIGTDVNVPNPMTIAAGVTPSLAAGTLLLVIA